MNAPQTCFFLTCDKRYFPYACVAAMRVRQVSPSMPGLILTVGVDHQSVKDAVQALGDSILVVDVGPYAAKLEVNTHRLGIATYLRLLADVLPEMQQFTRAIYMDCDTWAERDIENLASTELHAPLAAAHDVPQYFSDGFRRRLSLDAGAPYFNAGVLLMDLVAIRRHGLLELARDFAHTHRDICKQHDQDALNVVFSKKWQTMHPNWNGMTDFRGRKQFGRTWIRHFSWGKPWDPAPVGVESEALNSYRNLVRDTPWEKLYQGRPNRLGTMKKEISRKLDPIRALCGDSRVKRRAGYSAQKVEQALAEDAERFLMARWFPEALWIEKSIADKFDEQ